MSDTNCPYCQAEIEIDHDDGCGYEEDVRHEQECPSCEKTFVFITSISFYYETSQADCLNGEDHELYPVEAYPRHWPDWVRCKHCSYEKRGKYMEFVTATSSGATNP